MSPVYKKDKAEVFEALRRLGASTSDVLFSRGSVFVEGEHDVELLEAGFAERLHSFNLTALRGRQEIEKEIRRLQASEKNGSLKNPQVFIFDRDRQPIEIVDTPLVKVLQWDRYCLENYLIDPDIVFDVCEQARCKKSLTRGELRTMLKKLAMGQIAGVVARKIYSAKEPENPGLRSQEIETLSDYRDIGTRLSERLEEIKRQLSGFEASSWICEFEKEAQALHRKIEDDWGENWDSECSGKVLFRSFYHEVQPSMSLLEFKRRIASELAKNKRESWAVVDNRLARVLG